MSFFLILLLIAGALSPLIVQLIKLHVAKTKGVPALLLSVIVDLLLAVLIIWWAGTFTILLVVGATLMIFIVSGSVYLTVIQRFFPGKGSAQV